MSQAIISGYPAETKDGFVRTPKPQTEATERPTFSIEELCACAHILRPFMSVVQLRILGENAKDSEERLHFQDKMRELTSTIATMPKTYETDGAGMNAQAILHYFHGGSDWYITEKDSDPDGEGQIQAFGYTILNGDTQNAELGYINIQELVKYGVELDWYWTPKPVQAIRDQKEGN